MSEQMNDQRRYFLCMRDFYMAGGGLLEAVFSKGEVYESGPNGLDPTHLRFTDDDGDRHLMSISCLQLSNFVEVTVNHLTN